MNVTPSDLNAINELLFSSFIIGLFFAFIFFGLARLFIKRIISKINYPNRIKTEEGYLYRSLKGTYVSKQRKQDIEMENKLRWIRIYELRLKRLKQDL